MELRLAPSAKDDIKFFLHSGQKNLVKKIEHLLEELEVSPLQGTGKPEALKHELSGIWSRRINREHRLIYRVDEEVVTVLSVKGHYLK